MAATTVKRMLASWQLAQRGQIRAFTASAASQKAHNVGILAMESYIPTRFVSQEQLEVADGVSKGKYTIGLGQKKMAFVDDREDINSICLTAVQRLLDNYGIDPKDVGRVEVGTESLVDKSKSTKTTLMKLFEDAGNHDIEGATVMNACYGGTAALFNSQAWVESSDWDGRYALFVAADIAVYEAGPARPTGGCGAVAVLVGPEAPMRLVPKARSTHSVDVYDFYKPSLSSEYPAVDGALSQVSYIKAVDDCYNALMEKVSRMNKRHTFQTVESAFNHLVFHSPYNKLVQQSFRRMLYNDARRFKQANIALPSHLAPLAKFVDLAAKDTYTNKDLEKALQAIPTTVYDRMVGPSIEFSQNIGNSYTAAVYSNLVCLVDNLGKELEGRRMGIFSYGSGAIATMFTVDGIAAPPGASFSLPRIQQTVNLKQRLAERKEVTPAEFVDALKLREKMYGKSGTPAGSITHVPEGAYYLKEVLGNHNRVYARK